MKTLNTSEPSYIHKDSDWILMLLVSVTGLFGLGYILEGMYKSGIDSVISGTIFELLVGFTGLIGWFFIMLNGLSSTFPIYIDNYGGHYRTLFLRKKNLKWENVNNIAILKGKKGNNFKYNTIVCGRDPSKLVWSISVSEDDSYEELYKVIDYYVHKYEIEVTLESTLDGSVQRLDGMPKKLDFS